MKKKGVENKWGSLTEGWKSAVGAPLSIHIYLGIVQIFALAGKRNSHSTVENTIIKAWRGHPLVGWERHPLHFLKVLKEITSLKWTSFRPDDTTMAQTGYGRDIWSKASHNLTTVFFQKTALRFMPKNCRPSTGKTTKTARLAEDTQGPEINSPTSLETKGFCKTKCWIYQTPWSASRKACVRFFWHCPEPLHLLLHHWCSYDYCFPVYLQQYWAVG